MTVLSQKDISRCIVAPNTTARKVVQDWKKYVLPGRGKKENVVHKIDAIVYDLIK